MADDLSLLFKLKSQYDGKGVSDARASAQQLKKSFGPELAQSVSLSDKAFAGIDSTLKNFVAQNVPIVGRHVASLTTDIRSLTSELTKGGPQTARLAQQIDNLSKSSGKSTTEVSRFLTSFARLEGQAAKNEAAFKFFGGSVDLIGNKTAKFTPELEQAGAAMAGAAEEAGGLAASVAGVAGPIGIAAIAVGAMVGIVVVASKEIFDLTKRVSEFEGSLFDLSQQTGITVETLSALAVVAKTTGGNLATITQATVQFQRQLDDAQDPLSQAAEKFRKFNIETSDTESALRSAFAALAKMPEGFAQTNAAAEFFGARGGKQVLALLKESGGNIDAVIDKARELGILIDTDTARVADKFNDELAILEFQLRALSAVAADELIPAITEIVRSIGETVTALRPLASILGSLTGTFLRPVAEGIKGVSLAVQLLTQDWKGLAKAIKEAQDARDIKPLDVPAVQPVPLPGVPSAQQGATEAVNQAEAVVAAVKRSVAEQNQALAELFQSGRRNRDQEANETIAANKRILEADQQRVDALLRQKEVEINALQEAARNRGEVFSRDTEQYRNLAAQVQKLQQERLDKESEFEVTSRAIRVKAAKERADATRNQIKNETDLLTNELDRQIKNFEAQLQRGAVPEETALKTIEQLEQAKIDARIEGLQQQKAVGVLTVQDQKELDAEIQKLNQERDRLADEQNNRRLQREQDTAARTRDILISNLDTVLQLEQSAGEQRIETIKTLADLRVLTEQEAARQILQIRLDLIDDEVEATKARLEAAKSITDKDERVRTQADLNNRLKILTAERTATQSSGEREIESGRQRDLQNERRYADELEDIQERAEGIERDTAEEVIRLMRLHFADRRTIIRAQRDADLAEEAARHKRVADAIAVQQAEVNQQIRVLEKFIERLKPKTDEEIAEYDRLIKKLEALRQTRDALQRQQDSESKRTEIRKEGISERADEDIRRSSPLGKLGFDVEGAKDLGKQLLDSLLSPIEALKEAFAELQDAARQFVSETEESVVPLGDILSNAFEGVANAIGQTVSNWVLLGETGPAVMRKVLAQALASIAAEAAVNAIKELAVGFALLAVGDFAGAGNAFTSAAIWGAIGGVAAIAGRSAAGDLFKSKTAGIGGGRSEDSRSGQLDPLRLNREQPRPQNQIVVQIKMPPINVNPNTRFGAAVTAEWADDFRNGGITREISQTDGGNG